MWLHSPGHEWAGQVPAAQRTQEGNGVLRAEVGSEEEKGSWGTENQHRLLPQLHHGGSSGKERSGTLESDNPEFGFQPHMWVLAAFHEPSHWRLWFPRAMLELWPVMKHLFFGVRSVFPSETVFLLHEEEKARLTGIVVPNGQS